MLAMLDRTPYMISGSYYIERRHAIVLPRSHVALGAAGAVRRFLVLLAAPPFGAQPGEYDISLVSSSLSRADV